MAVHNQQRIKDCGYCQDGETTITCMEDAEGICPIRDTMPLLSEENLVVSEAYRRLQNSMQQVEGKKRLFTYIQPTEAEATMRIFDIPKNDMPEMFLRLQILEEVANNLRPMIIRK